MWELNCHFKNQLYFEKIVSSLNDDLIKKFIDQKFNAFKCFITFIFNILIKINYQKWRVFNNLMWLST